MEHLLWKQVNQKDLSLWWRRLFVQQNIQTHEAIWKSNRESRDAPAFAFFLPASLTRNKCPKRTDEKYRHSFMNIFCFIRFRRTKRWLVTSWKQNLNKNPFRNSQAISHSLFFFLSLSLSVSVSISISKADVWLPKPILANGPTLMWSDSQGQSYINQTNRNLMNNLECQGINLIMKKYNR